MIFYNDTNIMPWKVTQNNKYCIWGYTSENYTRYLHIPPVGTWEYMQIPGIVPD